MNWLVDLLTGNSAAHTVVVLGMVVALGLALGSIRVAGISLGIGGVLFAGIAFGHFGFTADPHVMEFMREFGLILFVFMLGLQVGPGFFASLKRNGLKLNFMAAAVVLLGVAVTLLIHYLFQVPMPVAAGLFSGATTNTPSLAAAQEALREIHDASAPELAMPGLGYAVSYPFGILGIILSMVLLRGIFKVNLGKEVAAVEQEHSANRPAVENANLEVQNPGIVGMRLGSVPGIAEMGAVISRLHRGGRSEVAEPDIVLENGDVIHVVGTPQEIEKLRVLIGNRSATDLKALPGEISARRIVVSRSEHLGKTFSELDFARREHVVITRVARGDVEFAAGGGVQVQFGDTLTAVGSPAGLGRVSQELGNSPKQLDHPHLIPIFLGIVLGVLVGSIPIAFPGIPAPLKLGLAGGPLIVAILLSQLGRLGPLIWFVPPGANFMMREFGIVLFLACVGLKSGHGFVDLLTNGDGLKWMGLAVAITILPLLVVGLVARIALKMNFVSLCGLMAGSMTDPPALVFANQLTKSDSATISYATVYPLVILLRVIAVQAMVLLVR